MKVHTPALIALLGSFAKGQPGLECREIMPDSAPVGFCHGRTERDQEAVKESNRQKAQQRGSGGNHLRSLGTVVTPPPSGTVYAPAEYDPVEGILLAYDSWDLDVVAGIAAGLTTSTDVSQSPVNVYMVVSSADQLQTTTSEFESAGADMSLVEFIV
jgi:hypothetical protein